MDFEKVIPISQAQSIKDGYCGWFTMAVAVQQARVVERGREMGVPHTFHSVALLIDKHNASVAVQQDVVDVLCFCCC